MAETPYLRSCCRCGGPLVPTTSTPDTPPWKCNACHRLYWVAELTQEARATYRPRQRDFGHKGSKPQRAVERAIADERYEANKRGVSLRREQLGLVHKRTLQGILSRGYLLSDEFKAHVEGQLR